MTAIRRHLPAIFYTICLILAIICFYFTISEALFSWFFPDELVASQTYHNLGGLWGCTKYYYLHTSINRLSADFGACFMAQTAALFSTPLMGWVFNRLIAYFLIPVSIAFLLKKITKIPLKFSLIAALIISTVALFLITASTNADTGPYSYGVDLAIYGTATITFFILITLFPKSIENKRYFSWFCVIYAVNLMSHEVFLVLSGFFLPLFAWYDYSLNRPTDKKGSFTVFIKNVLHNRKVWILSAIYLISALIITQAPGIAIRESFWPTTGTFADGFVHTILASEEVAYFLSQSYVFIVLLFSLGILFRLSAPDQHSSKNKLLYGLLFIAPWIYLLLLGFLVGISPALWTESSRTEAFRLLDPFLAHLVSTKKLLTKGGFCTSRALFLYVGVFLDVFLAGFFITGIVKKYIKNIAVKKIWPLATALFSTAVIIFLFHPDGIGSIRILPVLLDRRVDFSHYSPQKNREAHPESSLIHFVSPSFHVMETWGNRVFPKKVFPKNGPAGNHESDITDILVDNYLRINRNKGISPATVKLVFDIMDPRIKYQIDLWEGIAYSLYEVSPEESRVSFSKTIAPHPSS